MHSNSPATESSAQLSNPFVRYVTWLSRVAGWIAASMIVLAVAITCQMIFVRKVFNQSTVWQTEAVVYLMVAATLLGIPYVQTLKGHVNVDLLPLSLSVTLRRWLHVVVLVLSLAVVAVMFWYGFEYWHIAWERGWKSDTVWGVRLWIPYLALPVGFGLFFLQLLADLVSVLNRTERPFGIEKD